MPLRPGVPGGPTSPGNPTGPGLPHGPGNPGGAFLGCPVTESPGAPLAPGQRHEDNISEVCINENEFEVDKRKQNKNKYQIFYVCTDVLSSGPPETFVSCHLPPSPHVSRQCPLLTVQYRQNTKWKKQILDIS